jgi:hypothetical protein
MRKSFISALLFVASATSLKAEEAMVAVAANFAAPMHKIASRIPERNRPQTQLVVWVDGCLLCTN